MIAKPPDVAVGGDQGEPVAGDRSVVGLEVPDVGRLVSITELDPETGGVLVADLTEADEMEGEADE